MRIEGWRIDGFGVFRDYEVRGLTDGLTVLAGPNEAGKTTLLAFLRGVLFGFPNRRTREPQYPPLAGGAHGGAIFVCTSDGRVTVERRTGRRNGLRVVFEDGREGSAAELARLTGGADDTLFRSVFAFGHGDLASLGPLQRDEIRERIYSAHIAGAGHSAHRVISTLDDDAARLLRQRGVSRIGELAAGVEELVRRVQSATERAAQYPSLLEHEDAVRSEVVALTGEVVAIQQEVRRHECLIELWGVWSEREAARRELESLDPIDEFPPQGESRLAALSERVQSAARTAGGLAAELQQKQDARQELIARLDAKLAPLAAEVERCFDLIPVQRERVHQLSGAQMRLANTGQELAAKLAALGKEWNEERLALFNDLPAIGAELQAWGVRLGAIEASLRDSRQAWEASVRERDRQAQGVEPDRKLNAMHLEETDTAIRRLRQTRAELAAQEKTIEALERAARQRSASPSRGGVPRVAWIMALVILLLIFVSDWLSGGRFTTFGILLTAVSVVAILAWRSRKSVENSADDFSTAIENCRATISVLRASVAADAMQLGFASRDQVSQAELDVLAARISQDRQELTRREIQTAGFEMVKEEERRRKQILDAVESDARRERERWLQWTEGVALPPGLDPQRAAAFWSQVQSAKSAQLARNEAWSTVARHQPEVEAWNAGAAKLLESAGDPPTLQESLPGAIRQLYDRCLVQREARRSLEALDAVMAEIQSRFDAAQLELASADVALRKLFEEAGAPEEIVFRARLKTFERRRELARVIRDCTHRIEARAGEQRDSIEQALASGALESWREQRERALDRLDEHMEQRDELVGKLRMAEAARAELEQSADVASLAADVEGARTELARAAREWLVTSLAKSLVERTLTEYTRVHQPAVLREASTAFGRATCGRYERVVQEDGGNGLLVVDRRGQFRRPEDLSRGTLEQLLLCLRLGLAAEFGRRGAPLPLVMDDVLVNLDPERARAMAETLAGFSAGRQLLFFTCHPETASLLAEAAPSARSITLPGL